MPSPAARSGTSALRGTLRDAAAGGVAPDHLLGGSGLVGRHLRPAHTTQTFILAAGLAAMKPGAVVFDKACGDRVDEPALVAENGAAGFAFFARAGGTHRSAQHTENAAATPRIGGLTRDDLRRVVRSGADDIRHHARGGPLRAADLNHSQPEDLA